MNIYNKIIRKETILRILLAVAACFAIGSVGFFLATLLQQKNTTAITPSPHQLIVVQEEKDAAMQSLARSEASSTQPDTATKLQILARLNAQ